jgi:hypothetical protein
MTLWRNGRLLACVVISLIMAKIFGPQFTGVIPEAITGAIAALIGYGAYRFIFRPKISN